MANKNTKVAKRLSRAIQQWSTSIRPTWNVSQVKSALYTHQTGNFSDSARLVEAMMADDELPTSLNAAVNEIAGAPFSLDPVTDSDGEIIEASQQQADALSPYWSTSYPEHEIASLMRWFFMLGVGIGTIDWDTSVTPWKPKLRVLSPQFLYWDDSCINPQTGLYGAFRYNSRDGSNEIVTPGDGKWVLLSDGRDSWMRCSVRALANTWLQKQYAMRDWARYNERHGLPIIKAMVPFTAEAEDKESYFEDVNTLGTETTVMLPTAMDPEHPEVGFDLDLLEAKDQAFDSFKQTIERCDRKFQVHFAGSNTNELIGTAGSRATSESGRSIAAQTAAQRERRITTDLRDQLVKPFIGLNVANADLDLAPWPHYAVEGEEDSLRRAESIKNYADSIKALAEAGYQITNIEEESAKFGLVIEPMETTPNNDSSGKDDEKLSSDIVTDKDREEFAKLAANAVDPIDVGKRDGLMSAQEYLDGLTESLTTEADALEEIQAERMLEIIESAENPEQLKEALIKEANEASPVQLAAIFEKAILLSQLAGRFAVTEDL